MLGVAIFTMDCTNLFAEPSVESDVNSVVQRIGNRYTERNLEMMLEDFAEDAAITWYDAATYRTHESFMEMQSNLYGGVNSNIQSVTSDFRVDDEFVFQNASTVVATGQMTDHLKLVDGSELPTTARWTATLTPSDEGWKVVGFQASVNLFQNTILAKAKGTLVTTVAITGVFGVVLGFICGRLIQRSRGSESQNFPSQ
ncbi:hypothetical protein Q31b_05970 [Novipirellula aureliae]|uniref:SnoaL-like domain-containing protein n=1 Tax=Novipirellula aureliae TaxID=2527966 RepID=A0A5C6EA72_9BACT|nr:nuclear transport factor 2 family protein [Novipirellula aureliae]TWU45425.1 hypothetical protein Q31b_05970 [Novipirellula aureliae]